MSWQSRSPHSKYGRINASARMPSPPMQERWQLLEKHPIAELGTYKVTLLPKGEFKHGAIKACGAKKCETYAAASAKAKFKRAHAKPAS